MSGVPPLQNKFNLIKHKSNTNLYKMDLKDFNNVSAEQPSSSNQSSLNYDYFNNNPDYRKDIIVTVDQSMQANGVVHTFEIFENINRANKVLFDTKVNRLRLLLLQSTFIWFVYVFPFISFNIFQHILFFIFIQYIISMSSSCRVKREIFHRQNPNPAM